MESVKMKKQQAFETRTLVKAFDFIGNKMHGFNPFLQGLHSCNWQDSIFQDELERNTTFEYRLGRHNNDISFDYQSGVRCFAIYENAAWKWYALESDDFINDVWLSDILPEHYNGPLIYLSVYVSRLVGHKSIAEQNLVFVKNVIDSDPLLN